ncbi:hypothetical protein EJ110_NYTH29898 [Nymphaea thermarum]|nr:hypothetical protein EJ110_NYTH29898 [Nymphaea thermarum]
MESYLNENFGGVRSKNSSEEALRRWRRVCGIVKNRKRRFRFTANLSKRSEAEAMRRTNHKVNLKDVEDQNLDELQPATNMLQTKIVLIHLLILEFVLEEIIRIIEEAKK